MFLNIASLLDHGFVSQVIQVGNRAVGASDPHNST